MGLTQTVALVDAGSIAAPSTPTAVQLNDLLSALDEILSARFGSRSFLAFAAGTLPGIDIGDRFSFGTPVNLVGLTTAYDVAQETPAAPVGGQIVSWDVGTKVVFVTGITESVTLNRQHVTFTPPAGVADDYWFGWTRPQRFEPLRLADIAVEAYTDPVEATDTDFTFREHWDRHGCVRIHNGNRHAITVKFESGIQSDLIIPSYGIRVGRRTTFDGPFEFSKLYIAQTVAGDPMRWEKPHDGQFAASLELSALLCEAIVGEAWCRYISAKLDDQTALDAPHFAGGPTIERTDYFADWLGHKGKILSVVLDKRDGAVVVDELTYGGVASLPDAAWAGKVLCELDGTDTYLEFTTAATAPAGATSGEWEHDIIPISTNVMGLTPQSIRTTFQVDPNTLGAATVFASQPLGHWQLGDDGVTTTTQDLYEPFTNTTVSGGVAFVVSNALVDGSATSVLAGFGQLLSNPLSLAIPGAPPDGFDPGTEGLYRCLGALCSFQGLTLDGTEWTAGPSDFDPQLLRWAKTDAPGTLEYLRLAGVGPTGTLRHFAARIPRRYHSSGSVVGGFAVHGNHPSDSSVAGTADGLGGALGWTPAAVQTSRVQIEGVAWDQQPTVAGRDVYLPVDAIHWVLANINTPGWWLANRTAVMAGTVPEEAKLLTWRMPREAAEMNALATIVNSVREVFNVTIEDLHKDPLPTGCLVPPFNGFAVPILWGVGTYDTGGFLVLWLAAWGISAAGAVPDIGGLRGTTRQTWARLRDVIHVGPADPGGADVNVTYAIEARDHSDFDAVEHITTVGGETFSSYEVWSEAGMVHMFGAAYSDTDYVWATRGSIVAVFASLGVAMTPDLCGERYTPQHATSTSCSLVAGTIVGVADTQTPLRCDFHEWDGWVMDDTAFPIRNPFASSPTWMRVIGDYAVFRLSEPVGVDAPHYAIEDPDGGWDGTAPTEQDLIHEAQFTADERKCLWWGSRQTLPRFTSDVGPDAWPDVQHIYCARETLMVVSPETLFHRTFNHGTFRYDLNTDAASGYGVTVLTVPAATVVDSAYLVSEGLPVAPAYHCQFLRRTGVTRDI